MRTKFWCLEIFGMPEGLECWKQHKKKICLAKKLLKLKISKISSMNFNEYLASRKRRSKKGIFENRVRQNISKPPAGVDFLKIALNYCALRPTF